MFAKLEILLGLLVAVGCMALWLWRQKVGRSIFGFVGVSIGLFYGLIGFGDLVPG